jgi:sporulation protein YlmC with PRC-barrel domain
MTSLRHPIGKPAIVRDTAEQLGKVQYFVVDGGARRVQALAVSVGRGTQLVDWAQVESIGPDAVIVDGSHEPSGDDDRAVSGALHPLEKRVLSDRGNEIGTLDDVEIDDDGGVRTLVVGDAHVDGARLEGVGSYAVVIAADPSEA